MLQPFDSINVFLNCFIMIVIIIINSVYIVQLNTSGILKALYKPYRTYKCTISIHVWTYMNVHNYMHVYNALVCSMQVSQLTCCKQVSSPVASKSAYLLQASQLTCCNPISLPAAGQLAYLLQASQLTCCKYVSIPVACKSAYLLQASEHICCNQVSLPVASQSA